MSRYDVDRFVDGDRVSDGAGSFGYVRKCFNRQTRETFLKVLFTEGPRKGQWDATYRTTPDIHWSSNGITRRCSSCEREFRIPAPEDAIRQIFCKTCQRQLDGSTKRQEQDPDTKIDARVKWKIDHEGM